VRVVNELLSNYQHVIEDLRLITGSRGIFDVRIDGELVYSKDKTQCHISEGQILEIFDSLFPGTPRYKD
jgi:predicted Rdx family selenoprotein